MWSAVVVLSVVAVVVGCGCGGVRGGVCGGSRWWLCRWWLWLSAVWVVVVLFVAVCCCGGRVCLLSLLLSVLVVVVTSGCRVCGCVGGCSRWWPVAVVVLSVLVRGGVCAGWGTLTKALGNPERLCVHHFLHHGCCN